MTDESLENGPTEIAEPDAPERPRKPWPLRTKLLVGMLTAMTFTFAVNAGHIYLLESELEAIADAKELDQLQHFESVSSGVETASTVTASKENLVFGDVSGKIEVFVKHAGTGGQLVGFDYFLEQDDTGEWVIHETGTCIDDECQRRGAEAFARLPEE
jgi:hypothetical protein